MTRRPSWVGLALGFAIGAGVTLAILELPYVNWHPVVAPVDARPLVIRQDAKGDGRFLAPRSGNRRHQGVDLAAALDSPVRAIRSGVVVQVGSHRGLGRFVELEHRGALRSRYAHLNSVRATPGARVAQGDVIGTVGKTGNARHPWIAPHLHLEVLQGDEAVNPAALGLEIVEAEGPGRELGASAGDVDAGGGE